MNRDRGTLKWNALMLPEHVKLLREWQAEDNQVERPELEEWAIIEMNERLQLAIAQHLPITVTFWEDYSLHYMTGGIERYNSQNQQLIFSNKETVYMNQLVQVDIDATM